MSILRGVRPFLYIFFEYVKANWRNTVKVVILSSIILSYTLLSHYPKMYMSYRYVYPLEQSEATLFYKPDIPPGLIQYVNQMYVNGEIDDETYQLIINVSMNKRLLNMIFLDTIESEYTVDKVAEVTVKPAVLHVPGGETNVNLVSVIGDLQLLPMIIFSDKTGTGVGGRGVILSAFTLNSIEVGTEVAVDNKTFYVGGYGILHPIVSAGEKYVVAVGDVPGTAPSHITFVKLSTSCNNVDLTGLKASYLENIFYMLEHEYGVSFSDTTTVLVDAYYDGVVIKCIGDLVLQEKTHFEEEYGLKSQWGIVLLGGSIVFVVYLVRVALSDVAERMRDLLALLYAMGGTDRQAALILFLNGLLYIAPSITAALLINYAYINNAVGRAGIGLPLWLFITWFSRLVIIAISAALAFSVVFGVLAIRRQPLHKTLAGG